MTMARSEARQATKLMTFRLTPEDHAAIVAAAADQGVGPTTFARQAAFRAAGLGRPAYERRGPNPVAALLARAIGELGRIGSNVNQVARVANSRGDVDVRTFAEAMAELRRLRADILAAKEAAGG
jgi:hypothetical protein